MMINKNYNNNLHIYKPNMKKYKKLNYNYNLTMKFNNKRF